MAVKILIADDEPDLEPLLRQQFRRQLRDGLYDFQFARDGGEALEKVRADPDISILLTDINMPGMDGLTLLARLAEVNTSVQPVVVSAYGDLANIRAAMNRGAFDFLTKPIDFADFEATIAKTVNHVEALRQAAAARSSLTALQRELAIASQIQQSILPREFDGLPGVEVAAAMHAARNVGGDFYDFFPLPHGRVGLVVGDVSGKGVPAAILMAVTRTLLRAYALRDLKPGACLTEANTLLARDNDAGMFVTVFYGILDPAAGTLTYTNGGHNPPLRVAASGEVAELPGTGNTVAGAIEGLAYDTAEVPFGPGETLLLYSDGVTEAMDGGGKMFGTPRLRQVAAAAAGRPPAEFVRAVVEGVRAFAGAAAQSDDVTLLAARCRAGADDPAAL